MELPEAMKRLRTALNEVCNFPAEWEQPVRALMAQFEADTRLMETQGNTLLRETRDDSARKCLHELLHWIYPRQGDLEHRASHFIVEALVGFNLLNETHPFENIEAELLEARTIARQAQA